MKYIICISNVNIRLCAGDFFFCCLLPRRLGFSGQTEFEINLCQGFYLSKVKCCDLKLKEIHSSCAMIFLLCHTAVVCQEGLPRGCLLVRPTRWEKCAGDLDECRKYPLAADDVNNFAPGLHPIMFLTGTRIMVLPRQIVKDEEGGGLNPLWQQGSLLDELGT